LLFVVQISKCSTLNMSDVGANIDAERISWILLVSQLYLIFNI
jgi:hypothetical protein